jgi:glucose/mannose-6-phosphate isomerase
VVASSYSGETAEVLSAVDVALARGARIVAVTAGGTLARVAAVHGLPCVTMPAGLQPRLALGHLFFGLVTALRAACIPVATDREIDEALRILADCAVELVPESPAVENEAKRLAVAIDSRIAVIYGGPVTGAVAYRWKTDLEENAKAFAVAGTLPEMNHNELEAWQSPAARDLHLVCLRHAGEPPPITRRFALLRELIGARAAGISEVHGRGTTPLAVLLSLAYVGQWVSFYVAMLRGVDPWPVRLLDELKRRLAREPDGAPA